MKRFKKTIKNVLRQCGNLGGNKFPEGTWFIRESKAHLFFGYYDVSPFHGSSPKILSQRMKIPNVSPHDTSPTLEVGYFEKGIFQKFGETKSWNWQQGCRLQWHPVYNDYAMYNEFTEGRYQTRVVNIGSKITENILPAPVYCLSPDGKMALTLDFQRLHKYRAGYGYNNIKEQDSILSDAVYKMDLETGSVHPLLTYSHLRQGLKQEGADYINHLSYAPDGKNFIFFYIVVDAQGKRKTNLVCADDTGQNINFLMSGYTPSHFCWLDNKNILLTAAKDGILRYYKLDIVSGTYNPIDASSLNKDGHPSSLSNDEFISDTYPSYLGHQTFFKYSFTSGNLSNIARFYTPLNYNGEMRCDLHPRLSPDKKLAALDVVLDGYRAMAIIPLEA